MHLIPVLLILVLYHLVITLRTKNRVSTTCRSSSLKSEEQNLPPAFITSSALTPKAVPLIISLLNKSPTPIVSTSHSKKRDLVRISNDHHVKKRETHSSIIFPPEFPFHFPKMNAGKTIKHKNINKEKQQEIKKKKSRSVSIAKGVK